MDDSRSIGLENDDRLDDFGPVDNQSQRASVKKSTEVRKDENNNKDEVEDDDDGLGSDDEDDDEGTQTYWRVKAKEGHKVSIDQSSLCLRCLQVLL